MIHSEEIRKELEAISPAVANLGKLNVFEVPEGYFEVLPDLVLSKINREEIPSFLSGEPKNIFDAPPAGYFDQLPLTIMERIRREEAGVASFGNEEKEQGARVVKLKPRRKIYDLLAAAAILFAIAGAIWFIFPGKGPTTRVDIASKASKNAGNLGDSIVKSLTDKDLISYLSATIDFPESDLPPVDQSIALLDFTEREMDEILDEIPIEAIEAYVSENPDIAYSGTSTN